MSSLHNIYDANKFTKPNFLDWYWIMRIAFKQERILYVLENPIPLVLDEDVDNEVKNEYQCHIDYNEFPT